MKILANDGISNSGVKKLESNGFERFYKGHYKLDKTESKLIMELCRPTF